MWVIAHPSRNPVSPVLISCPPTNQTDNRSPVVMANKTQDKELVQIAEVGMCYLRAMKVAVCGDHSALGLNSNKATCTRVGF
jgi:hypothetical protein